MESTEGLYLYSEMWKIQKFRETTRKTAFVRSAGSNLLYEDVMQATFKIVLMILEEES